MKTNFHTHTYRCKHAWGTEEDFVEEAIKNGLSELGFSDHGPFPDKDYGLRMEYDELSDYIKTIDELKLKYADKIKLYKGLEIEYHKKYNDYYKYLLTEAGIDYLLLGQHNYTDSRGELKYITAAKATSEYLEFAASIEEAAGTGFFSFIAHPDLLCKNNFAWDENMKKTFEIIIDTAEKYDIPLEVNANGLRRGMQYFPDGMRYQYPDDRFWKMVRGRNVRVAVGSDCHAVEQLWDHHIPVAYNYCESFRLNVTEHPIKLYEGN